MSSPDPTDTAWRIHGALVDWTGKVDGKASFASALEIAVLGAVLTQTTDNRRLADLHHWEKVWFAAGAIGLVASIVLVLLVVIPQLRSKAKLKIEAPSNFIYFGHLRLRDPQDVEGSLRSTPDMLPVLSRQLVSMSKIAWRKHRMLQVSLLGTVVSCSCIAVAAAMNG